MVQQMIREISIYQQYLLQLEGYKLIASKWHLRGYYTIFPEICKFFCTCHNFSPLSSVQIIIIPACCLLCVL